MIDEIKNKIDLKHEILSSIVEINPVQDARDIFGMFQTITAVPTKEPTGFLDQIQIYVSGGVYRLYIFERVNRVWKYVVLT